MSGFREKWGMGGPGNLLVILQGALSGLSTS